MKTFFLILTLFIFLALPTTVNAHSFGQPPYFKINGQYANLYPVYSSSVANFSLPQDLAPTPYLSNQKIGFEIDTNVLPVPQEIIRKTNFSWDFGDGQKDSGIKTEHSYSKIGTYLLTIYADDKTTPKPQLFESIPINVIPNTGYKLPSATIKVNGRESRDPLTDIIRLDFAKDVQFTAENIQGSGQSVSYFWDFGDLKSSTDKNPKHTYATDLTQVFPLLHVKDENGFIVDSFVELENQKLGQNQFSKTQKATNTTIKNQKSSQLKYTLPALGIFVLLLFVALKFRKKRVKTN